MEKFSLLKRSLVAATLLMGGVNALAEPFIFNGGTQITTDDKASEVTPFAGITLTDDDSTEFTATISLDSAAKGTLSATSIVSGDKETVQAAIQAITFTPTQNRVTAGSAETTTITLTVTADGKDATTTNTVVSTSINDEPTITSTPITIGYKDTLYSYELKATDVDADANLTWSATAGTTLPEWLSIKPNYVQTTFAGTGARPTTNGGTSDSVDGTSALASKIQTSSISLDSSSRVFFTDKEEHGVRYIDTDGNIQTFYAGNGTYQNLNPTAVAYDSSRAVVYVADYGNHKIVKIAQDGTRTDLVASRSLKYYPRTILLDSTNDFLYVGTRTTIYKIDLTNNNKTVIVGDEALEGSYLDTGIASTSKVSTK